jgi:hypothetical protein
LTGPLHSIEGKFAKRVNMGLADLLKPSSFKSAQ